MVCVKCGQQSSETTCRNCGYNHSLESVVMLEAFAFDSFSSDLQHPDMKFSGSTLIEYIGNETRVHVPDGVTCIGPLAFKETRNLQEITIPGTVKEICEEAFYRCRSLEIVHLNEGLECIGDTAFADNDNLRKISIPKTVKTICDWAFWGCFSLETVHLIDGLECIGEHAFEDCMSLVDITLPETLVSIGRCAFLRSGLEHVVIPGSMHVIGQESFFGCELLNTVHLNTGIRTIEGGAFHCCDIKHIYVPDTLEEINSCWNEDLEEQQPAFDEATSWSPREIYASNKWKEEHPELILRILGKY